MVELFKNKQYRNLLISLVALDGVQLFILYAFWEWFFFRGSDIDVEIAFIIYSAIIVIILIAVPFLVKRKGLLECPKTLSRIAYISIAAAFASAFIALLPGVKSLFISLSLITLFIFIPHAICLMRTARELPEKLIGRAIGLMAAVSMLLGLISVILAYELESMLLVYIVFTVLIAVAVIFFRPGTSSSETESKSETDSKPELEAEVAGKPGLFRRFVIVGMIAVFCYAIIAGLDDNIRYILEMKYDFEGLFSAWFVFIIGALIYLLAGYLTDKIKFTKYVIITCLIAICIIFSILLVVDNEVMDIVYFFASKLPIYMLWVVGIALPIRRAKQYPQYAGFGYAILYFGMFLTSILFLYLPEGQYIVPISMVLIFTVAAMILVSYLYSENQRQNFLAQIKTQNEELSILSQNKSDEKRINGHNADYSGLVSKYELTLREGELFPLVISPLTANEIADAENISVATVKFHIRNILSKTSCSNRRALQILVEGKSIYDNNKHSMDK